MTFVFYLKASLSPPDPSYLSGFSPPRRSLPPRCQQLHTLFKLKVSLGFPTHRLSDLSFIRFMLLDALNTSDSQRNPAGGSVLFSSLLAEKLLRRKMSS